MTIPLHQWRNMAMQAEFKKRVKKPRKYPEHELCAAFWKLLPAEFKERAIIYHTPNEHKGKFSGKLRQEIGVVAGVLDYHIACFGSSYYLEAKAEARKRHKDGGLSPEQVAFTKKLDKQKILWAVFYTPEEGLRKLKEWGLL